MHITVIGTILLRVTFTYIILLHFLIYDDSWVCIFLVGFANSTNTRRKDYTKIKTLRLSI